MLTLLGRDATWWMALALASALGCAARPAGPAGTTVAQVAPVSAYLQCSEQSDDPRSPGARAAVGACRTAAEGGSATAAFVLSQILRYNRDLADPKGWVFWCERAAQQGHPIAQYVLAANLAESGDPRAKVLLNQSACAGFPRAQDAVGEMAGADPTMGSCPEREGLDGAWEGDLTVVAIDRERGHAHEPITTRLTIDGATVGVRVRQRGEWRDIKPASFQVRRHKDSAVIHAVDDGWDNDGNWIETWVFSVTILDHDHLRAVYHRVVNNVYMDRKEDQAVFWYVAAGDLTRVANGK